MSRTFLLLILVVLLSSSLMGQESYEIFYLCIGSGHYEKDLDVLEPGFNGLDDQSAAVASAIRMQALLSKIGALGGDTLLSREFYFLSSKKILDATEALVRRAKKSRAKKPLLFVYYCGHGFSSGRSQAHFIPPGTLARNPENFSLEDWDEQMISPISIREILSESGYNYILMLDCCYEGEQKVEERLSKREIALFGLEKYDELMGDVFPLLVALNKMIGPDPAIFATEAGHVAPTTRHRFGDQAEEVGPLCRRSYMAVEALSSNSNLTLRGFVSRIISPSLDPSTPTSVTFWYPDESADNFLIKNLK